MKLRLSDEQKGKVDDHLLQALEDAEAENLIRTIMVLDTGRGPDGAVPADPHAYRDGHGYDSRFGAVGTIIPSQFESRVAYRQALIDRRERQMKYELSDTINALNALSLSVKGGALSPVVVVEGPAIGIARSLDLGGVRHASLDREIELINPRVSRGPLRG